MADILNKLNSANYVTVKVTDNAIVNGNNLLATYALAKTVSPNGAALSTSNRLAVILNLKTALYEVMVFEAESLVEELNGELEGKMYKGMICCEKKHE